MMKKVLIVSANRDATQEISFFEPSRFAASESFFFEHLNYSVAKKMLGKQSTIDHLRTISPDCIIISRLVLDISQKCIDYCKSQSIPSIFHLDDDLFNVPKSVGEAKYNHYSSPKFLGSLHSIVSQVDRVLVSTQALHEILNTYGVNNTVVMHHYRSYMAREAEDVKSFRPYPVIGYMGSGSHMADLERILPAVITLLRRYSCLHFETFGIDVPPSLSDEFANRVKQHQKVNSYEEFLLCLKKLGWWAGLAPLEHSSFNFCKANTKWVEYTESGIPSIVESFGPYKILADHGLVKDAISIEDWSNSIDLLLRNRKARAEVLSNSVEYLKLNNSPKDLMGFYEVLIDNLIFETRGRR